MIRPIGGAGEVAACAQMMAGSEPWITLQRDYPACVGTLTSPDKEVYVAAAPRGEVLGFVVLNLQGGFIGYIQSLCVAADHRNHGIGRQLVAFAEKRVFRISPNVFICVSSFNPGAQQFYRRLGYAVVGELPDFIVRGHSEILLRKTIAPWREFQKHPD
jgi:ribosomal protein S18 acetylase RimI-like enzyme